MSDFLLQEDGSKLILEDASGFIILEESACFLLQEDGFKILLEDGTGFILLEFCEPPPPAETPFQTYIPTFRCRRGR